MIKNMFPNDKLSKEDSSSIMIEERQLGVWTLRTAVPSTISRNPRELWTEFQKAVPFLLRLFTDIFNIAPYHLIVYLACQFAEGLEEVLILGFSDKLLRAIEISLIEGKPNISEVVASIFSQLACSFLFIFLKQYSNNIHGILRVKVTSQFQLMLMKSSLRLDLAASQEAASKSEVSAGDAFRALERIVSLTTDVLRSGSQLAFIAHTSRSTGGPWFVVISLAHPFVYTYLAPSLWDKVCFGYVANPIYQRIKSLEKFAAGALRQDIISGGLAGWITSEYQSAHRDLGDLNTEHPSEQVYNGQPVLARMLLEVTELAPMIFCALNATLNPANFSISSIALLQQSSTYLRFSLQTTLTRGGSMSRSLSSLKDIYRDEIIRNPMDTGIIPYPHSTEKPMRGMSFELSGISFSYPGTQKTSPALKDVSLKIQAGQLIVIVGANGSGKSTLIRILSRLYDPASGTVHIDGRPSEDYIVSDLHEATALLSQDNQLYPLSLHENIGPGYLDKVQDRRLVHQAAEQGGAIEFISKLRDGMDTFLEPIIQPFQINLYRNKTHVLFKEMDALRKKIDISGGERQKVVAARSFMRFQSGKIKFVAVDEPSSALDAESELKLFENLIKVRDGKTLVFVTHRFGHLTKYADQIICMKDGSIYEVGSHEELIDKNGEYAKLYKIQASAFAAQ